MFLYNENNFLHTPVLNVIQYWAKYLWKEGEELAEMTAFLGGEGQVL